MLAGTKAAPVLCHQKLASGDMTVPDDVPRDRNRRWPILITREEGHLAMTWSRSPTLPIVAQNLCWNKMERAISDLLCKLTCGCAFNAYC
jgi:hypothetical protein